MSDIEQWEHDEQRAMENEIISLREQVEKLTKERDELKTVPMKYRRMQFNAEIQDEVTQLQKQLAALAEQNDKMRSAVRWIQDRCAGDAMPRWEPGMRTTHSRGLILDRTNYVLDLPDLASPVLNRIRAEGMRMASTFISLVRNDWASAGDNLSLQAAEYLISALDTRADELEKTNG